MRFRYSTTGPAQDESDSLPRVPLVLRSDVQVVDVVGLVDSGATVREENRQRPLRSPFGDEELARRQQVPGGRPLAEIWKNLADR